ncbi:tellurium resistance protein TerC [Chromatiales bacterium (ex Bugula neritina AB1)]|nr:tellurium resistance protein TerC [Chromatiales bacterium (ex Bugula neritina AB1)]
MELLNNLFTLDNLITLFLLTLLQAVLGFDNLLYISLESKRAPAEQQAKVRKWGIGIAIGLRIILLFALTSLIAVFQEPVFGMHWVDVLEFNFNIHAIIVLLGGIFIIYTATKEILHMMAIEEHEHGEKKSSSAVTVVIWIVLMNLVFSFDSILSAIALTSNFIVMATAIIISGILMIWLADHVSDFLQKNRMYEVLGLFILFVVGIMLISEGGHLSHMKILGTEVTPMTKATFYFVIVVLAFSDVVQSRYQRKLLREKKRMQESRNA